MKIIFICVCITRPGKLVDKLFKSIKELNKPKKYKVKYLFLLNGVKNFKIKLRIKDFLLIEVKKKIKIPQARNLILKKLRKLNFDYVGFIDDDCIFKKNWLVNHLNILNKSKKFDISSGPQISEPFNIYHKILEPNFKNNSSPGWCPTNNVFFKSNVLKKTKIHFDIRFDKIGGSDQLFFNKISRLGFKIIWKKNNYVIECQDPIRFQLNWFIKRNLRYGSSGFLIDKEIYGLVNGTFISLIKVFYYFILSFYFILIIFLNPKINFLKSLQFFARSLARFKAFFFINKNYI